MKEKPGQRRPVRPAPDVRKAANRARFEPLPAGDADGGSPSPKETTAAGKDFKKAWLASSGKELASRPAPSFRHSELVMAGYFLYAAAVSAALPVARPVTAFTIGLNLTLIGVFVALSYAGRLRPASAVISIARDWLPLAVLVLAYREMGWFAPTQHTLVLENSWVRWDRLLLGSWGLQAAIEYFGPALPALLELCYALVYTIGPVSLATIYLWGRRERADAFLFRFLLGTVLSYTLFPYFPSEPPRTVFPGELFPHYDTVFRHFNWWLLAGHGIHTSVFPSAHVSSAYAAAFAMFRVMPERKWAGWFLVALATGIFWATIYGRYHYAVDAVAGLAVAVVAFLAADWITRRAGSGGV